MTEETTVVKESLIELTTDIVAAYVSNNPVPASELPTLIANTHAAISGLRSVSSTEVEEKPIPAVSIRKSVTPNFLICLEDSKKFKSLKRHLATHHNLTPDEYRQKWNLPADYPMVAPNYSAARSAMAKSMGLGRKPGSGKKSGTASKPAQRKKLGPKFS
ncbi:MucR family transcriptional regulator [Manganibacter manganicus]|uniref:MucR family transcriptional regulator n=1 Tax=Manganibacter manganicus TaxID=1873176 RepID=A0A1V8RJL7_9HYPH|nr:MucR family transcriptional regulator [Pseudaminobacter manganicus]OQM73405.1 MucR family transcriptional regulator [Pseudaminobacter manganicus]